MENKTTCGQCKYLKEGEGVVSFINPQGIPTTNHRGRYYCEADTSRKFTDEQIKEFRDCSSFRPRTLTLWQEVIQKIFLFSKQILLKIWEFFKPSNFGK
ncbi:hypothetical protein KKE19_02510 [Patescibacteria group bacterium]|nr:hypothetical protein [Patescibacteria group bacterium]MBU4367708.1 hypothetical protein [Patescibacteria group bacterium]MBU4461842.1 hypothetical protein [Patescibacteria group bacterium]MCG2700027.1 hypothetical protein [Candidatus Parcubacteria bacterium]